ncbi:winged helix-turn-helix transcriptional regulator [Pseudosulfitobacter pseudonitzschiae]|uniref:winged helix-turn-helix transcriptional regulator n=1 Tax=Pseudosulfitobacter pseudonitzschiae TaxID=1402135 RepID=UPI001AF686EB|nr:helix-turn-helix domain-containing protein [Pseudosulfitobacter pseudonitzschiae]MBM1817497.1 helix-turn-helix transcriptional regulator [Pseudosulfitobacter pseudonitzschiae]MBM1834412.1 helix-turn-helix transcriptional regulator [Pseudosulfitobacter pseudonitzschiae]MBM1839273.1 helix-turn-helix transcriptional regulator [Pseudosulfitobacter pseudonitzschiae]MBM1844127.1 helix-turn-helix transcriptional regulator [Pseudosulfitobacter pseudonitzschiae]MBM1848958.1 helix-turn-helix transcri
MDQSDNFDIAARGWTTVQGRNRDALHGWCALAVGLQAVRGQWKASIIVALSEGAASLPQLQKRLPDADRRVLVRALRQLEADALVVRTETTQVTYMLTPDGVALADILHALAEWQAQRG